MKGKMTKKTVTLISCIAILLIAAIVAGIIVMNHRQPVKPVEKPIAEQMEESDVPPVLELDYNNVAIGLDYSFTVSPRITWQGETVEEEVACDWQLGEGAAEDVVSMKQTGNSAVLTGLKYGDTSFVVSTTYKDMVLVKELNVSVTDVDVMFESPNMKMSAGCFQVDLGLVATEKDITSITPVVKVYDKEKLVKDAKFTWENSKEAIASLDKSGKITAKKAGKTEITGLYKESKLLIKVNVYRPELTMDPVYIEASKNYVISSSKWNQGTVEKVTFADKDVMKMGGANGSSITLDSKKLPELGTKGELVVQTSKVKYIADSMVVTMAINNEATLNKFPSVAQKNKGEGYYALSADIHCKGSYKSGLDVDFNGTFDGNGYVIFDMQTADADGGYRGLLGKALGENGVVKNISFVRAKHGGQGSFIATNAAGKMENVYIQIEITDCTTDGYDGATSVLASGTYGVFTTKNVIVEYTSSLPADAVTGYALWQLHYGYAKHQGLYVIGCDKAAASENDLKGGLTDDYAAFVNYGEFVDANKDVKGWDDKFWKVTGKIPYPKRLETRKGTVPKVKLPTYVGTDSTVALDGLTIYDRVIISSAMSKYKIKIKNGALVIPKNVPSGTVLNITVQSAFDASKKTTVKTTVLTSKKATISKVTAVEKGAGKTFIVDLKDKKSLLKGATLTDVTLGDRTISDATYKNNKLTIKTSYLGELGEKTLQAYFKSGSKLIIVDVCVDVCTYSISNEAELNKLGSMIAKNKGEGRYVLTNHITCKGTYDANTSVEFNGTFEGHGYAITNMKTSDRDGANRGLIGWALGGRGIIKNVAFVNAKHSGKGGFLATQGSGTMENIYVQITVSKTTVDSFDGATSVLTSSAYGVFNTRNVIVEYKNPLAEDAKTGYAVWQLHHGYNKHQGLYVIGENQVATEYNDLGGGLKDSYAAYVNYGEFVQAKIPTEVWDSSFWKVTNKVPYPRRLTQRKATTPKVSLPTYVGRNSSVKLDGLTVCDKVVVSATMKKYGIKVKDGYLVIPKNVPSGTVLKITVESAFNASKKTTVKTTVLTSKKVTVSKMHAIEKTGTTNFTLDLSNQSQLKGKLTMTDLTIGGNAVSGASHKNGILTIPRKSLGELGEKELQAYFKSSDELVIATVKLDVCTMAIKSEAELNQMTATIKKNNGDGRYVLANDITCKGTYNGNISTKFNGTFEGHGYTIYNLTTADTDSSIRGFLGREIGPTGVLRNVSFVNAKHSGVGGFLTTNADGLMENIYIQIAVSGCTADQYDGATAVLACNTVGTFTTKNVVVEYTQSLPDNAKTGYAIWSMHYGYAKHQNLYVVGCDKVAASENNLGGGLADSYAAYANYGDFISANISSKSWDSSFWQVTNKVPYPKHLGKRTGTKPNVSIPTYTGRGAKIEIIGLTVCDNAVLDANSKKLGVTIKDGIIRVPNNIAVGTTIKVTVSSAFDSSKKMTIQTKVIRSEAFTLTGVRDIEKDDTKTVAIDFKSQASKVAGCSIVSATLDKTAFKTATFKDGILTLDKATFASMGEREVTVLMKNDTTLYTITIKVDVCTMSIKTEEDLNRMPSVIKANGGEGRYVLAADITCTGTYDANISTAFIGTFDGRGYKIENFTTSDREGSNRGLVGSKLGGAGIVKNVSFVNAFHNGSGGLIAASGEGTIENVYMQLTIEKPTTGTYEGATSALVSATYGVFSTKHVVVEYKKPLPDGAKTGHAVWQLYHGYNKHQGLYVVGLDQVATVITDLKGGLKDTYKAYKNYGDFAAANEKLTGWDTTFWTVKNHIPYPTRLLGKEITLPQVRLPESVAAGATVAIEGAGLTEQAILATKFTNMGITVEDHKLTIPESVAAGTIVEVTVRSVFDTSKSVKLTTKVMVSKNLTMSQFVGLGLHGKDRVEIDLAAYAADLKDTTLLSATLEGAALADTTFTGNVLSIKSELLTAMGEQNIVATFKGDNALVTITIPVDVCTWAIKTEADLNQMGAVIAANAGKGRYILCNHIVCAGEYDANLNSTNEKDEFVGTFDGHGFGIYNMKTSSRNSGGRAFIGYGFGTDGVIKNVSFFHAQHGGQGGFLATNAKGTMENVYVQITITAIHPVTGDGATSVFGSSTYGVTSHKKVIVEYETPLPSGSVSGYPLGNLWYSYKKHDGFYAIGVAKMAQSESNLNGPLRDVYGAYANYDAMMQAEKVNWENEFWTMKDNKPCPKLQKGGE